jgi:hypothetical protein
MYALCSSAVMMNAARPHRIVASNELTKKEGQARKRKNAREPGENAVFFSRPTLLFYPQQSRGQEKKNEG